MVEVVQTGLVQATAVARESELLKAPNGVRYAASGENNLTNADLERIVQAVPVSIAAALSKLAYYFVPLAISGRDGESLNAKSGAEETMIALTYTSELSDQAICHRNVPLGATDGVFISTRLLGDRFALAFEFFINVGHAFVDTAGVPKGFADLVWTQVLADVRGETSQDAWESRAQALPEAKSGDRTKVDEKARNTYLEAAFSDAVAIYLLSLAIDFDYAELREREYPLLAPQSLAERLRLMARLFPANAGYEFAIRYRRRK